MSCLKEILHADCTSLERIWVTYLGLVFNLFGHTQSGSSFIPKWKLNFRVLYHFILSFNCHSTFCVTSRKLSSFISLYLSNPIKCKFKQLVWIIELTRKLSRFLILSIDCDCWMAILNTTGSTCVFKLDLKKCSCHHCLA